MGRRLLKTLKEQLSVFNVKLIPFFGCTGKGKGI
jgi:hypothetical protein